MVRTSHPLQAWPMTQAASGTFAGRKSTNCSTLSNRQMTVYLHGPRHMWRTVPGAREFIVQRLVSVIRTLSVHHTRRLVWTWPDLLSFGKPKSSKLNSLPNGWTFPAWDESSNRGAGSSLLSSAPIATQTEMEQDPMVQALMSSTCLLSVEKL